MKSTGYGYNGWYSMRSESMVRNLFLTILSISVIIVYKVVLDFLIKLVYYISFYLLYM